MQIRVRLFAALRERAGTDEVELELPEGATVSDALAQLDHVVDGVGAVMAVNREGGEVALIPPVSGGAVASAHVRVTDQPLAVDPLLHYVRDPRAGAVVTFL